MDVSAVIDTILDRSVAFGYASTGIKIRRRLPGWPAEPPRMDGKVVLVTGAASGVGLAAAAGFARLGARVWGWLGMMSVPGRQPGGLRPAPQAARLRCILLRAI